MRNTLLLIIFLAMVAMGLWLWLLQQHQVRKEPEGNTIKVGQTVVAVELADSPEEWLRGLSGRSTLGENEGMLFVFPGSERRSFWMQDMRFPLDMIFINQGKVIEIVTHVPAPHEGEDGRQIRVLSQEPAEWALEVNSGWTERHGVKVGDRAELLQ